MAREPRKGVLNFNPSWKIYSEPDPTVSLNTLFHNSRRDISASLALGPFPARSLILPSRVEPVHMRDALQDVQNRIYSLKLRRPGRTGLIDG